MCTRHIVHLYIGEWQPITIMLSAALLHLCHRQLKRCRRRLKTWRAPFSRPLHPGPKEIGGLTRWCSAQNGVCAGEYFMYRDRESDKKLVNSELYSNHSSVLSLFFFLPKLFFLPATLLPNIWYRSTLSWIPFFHRRHSHSARPVQMHCAVLPRTDEQQ